MTGKEQIRVTRFSDDIDIFHPFLNGSEDSMFLNYKLFSSIRICESVDEIEAILKLKNPFYLVKENTLYFNLKISSVPNKLLCRMENFVVFYFFF